MKTRSFRRDIAFWLSGMLIATMLITPAGAHVGKTVAHLWRHLKPKVTALVYTKSQADARYLGKTATAADADLLDGKDSTEFLGVNDQAQDSDKLDGLDSTDFRTPAEPTHIVQAPGGLSEFNNGQDGAWCSWTIFAGDHAPPGFYKDGDGIVHLQGVIKAVDGTSICGGHIPTDYLMFTLPDGWRPAQLRLFSVLAGNELARVNIHPNGDVMLDPIHINSWDHARSYVQLDGIEFHADTSA